MTSVLDDYFLPSDSATANLQAEVDQAWRDLLQGGGKNACPNNTVIMSDFLADREAGHGRRARVAAFARKHESPDYRSRG